MLEKKNYPSGTNYLIIRVDIKRPRLIRLSARLYGRAKRRIIRLETVSLKLYLDGNGFLLNFDLIRRVVPITARTRTLEMTLPSFLRQCRHKAFWL